MLVLLWPFTPVPLSLMPATAWKLSLNPYTPVPSSLRPDKPETTPLATAVTLAVPLEVPIRILPLLSVMTELFCVNAPVHFAILPAVAPFVVTGVCAGVDETPPIVSASSVAMFTAVRSRLVRTAPAVRRAHVRSRNRSSFVPSFIMRLPSFREFDRVTASRLPLYRRGSAASTPGHRHQRIAGAARRRETQARGVVGLLRRLVRLRLPALVLQLPHQLRVCRPLDAPLLRLPERLRRQVVPALRL